MQTLTYAFALSVVALPLGSASAAERPCVEHNVATFLQSLEGASTLDSMTQVEARAALAGAQAAPEVVLPAVVALMANEKDLRSQLLLSPVTDANFGTPSTLI